MKRVVKPEALPGCCFFCRSDNREYYIDTEISTEMEDIIPGSLYGAIYICNECLREALDLTDLISKYKAHVLNNKIEQLSLQNYNLKVELDAYASFKSAFSLLRSSSDLINDSDSNTDVPSKEGEREQPRSFKQVDESKLVSVRTNESGAKGFSLNL